jgi:hypothetical protein
MIIRPSRLVRYAVLGAALVPLLALGCGRPVSTRKGARAPAQKQEDVRELARASLVKAPDLTTCRTSLAQLGNYLADHADVKPTPLSSEAHALLTKEFGLIADELAEVESTAFTPLDASHLEFRCLLRDGLSSLALDGLSPLERAVAGFDWVMRQVRWEERGKLALSQDFMLPADFVLGPDFVLRAGHGTAMERALVFLNTLDQLGIDAVLLAAPTTGDQPRLWACGALIDKAIYLFDPRLGIPLPGPGGAGVATLAQAQKEPGVLGQLTIDAKLPYDVTMEQARGARLVVGCPLSSLAPRMQLLQDTLLGPAVRVRLWTDLVGRIHKCQEIAGTEAKVTVAREAVLAQRLFLPPDEGGIDKHNIKAFMRESLVPLAFLPTEIVRLEGELRDRTIGAFAGRFISLALMPGKPRDQALRGRFDEVIPVLQTIRERGDDQWNKWIADRQELGQRLKQWHTAAVESHAQLIMAQEARKRGTAADVEGARKRVDDVWERGGGTLITIIDGCAAEPFRQQATYLLALCRHEQAEHLQTRLERAPVEEKELLKAQAREAWGDAKSLWDFVINDPPLLFPGRASRSSIIAARWLRARAYAAFGDKSSAVSQLRDFTSAPFSDLEKTLFLYRAAQIEKPAK